MPDATESKFAMNDGSVSEALGRLGERHDDLLERIDELNEQILSALSRSARKSSDAA